MMSFRDMIRLVLGQLRRAGRVECLGRGPGAIWRVKGALVARRRRSTLKKM